MEYFRDNWKAAVFAGVIGWIIADTGHYIIFDLLWHLDWTALWRTLWSSITTLSLPTFPKLPTPQPQQTKYELFNLAIILVALAITLYCRIRHRYKRPGRVYYVTVMMNSVILLVSANLFYHMVFDSDYQFAQFISSEKERLLWVLFGATASVFGPWFNAVVDGEISD